jgi:peroxiredoxin
VHLRGALLPEFALLSTAGERVSLRSLPERCVLFFYPRTGIPGQPPGLGFRGEEWDSIPGARGCTPQSCGFRDLYSEFRALGAEILGVSTNTTEHQREFKDRNHVPFALLSDSGLALTRALRLPTFDFLIESGGPSTMLHRMAWYVERGRIAKVWYPVFPPDRNAAEVLAWLRARAAIRIEPVAPGDIEFVRAELRRNWLRTTIWSIGRPYEADALPGFVARLEGRPAGLVTLHFDDKAQMCEVITLSSAADDRGVGTALMDAAENAARERGCTRLFLTTSNDNLRALRFYQRRGYRIAAVHRGMIDRYREMYKAIPRIGAGGIPLHDEIELEWPLE